MLKSEDSFANIDTILKTKMQLEDRDFFWESHRFAKQGYLKINHLIPTELVNLVGEEVKWLLENFGKRRDVHIESTGNTPRYLTNVIMEDIESHGRVIPYLYHSRGLMQLIEGIVRENIITVPWKWDKFIINSQFKAGDTHGWHWGDYPFTIIWVVAAPTIKQGGLLECVPHTYWDKRNPRIEELLVENKVDSYFHEAGDVYLLKADTTLHRVKPIYTDCTRIILNTTWEREKDKDRYVEHETFSFRN